MRRLAQWTLVGMATLVLSCGVLGGGEDYKDATIEQAMTGEVESSTDSYRLANPQVVAVKGDYAVLREGRYVQILAADGFDTLYTELQGKDHMLLVKKWPNPYPHFRFQGYVLEGEEHAGTWILGESELPLLIDPRLYDVSRFAKLDASGWEASGPPRDLVDQNIWIQVRVDKIEVEAEDLQVVEETDLIVQPESLLAAALGEEAVSDTEMVMRGGAARTRRGQEYLFIAEAGGAKLMLPLVQEDGVKALMLALANEGKPFFMGGYITELFPRRRQAEVGANGSFQLQVFEYGGKYVILR